MEKSIEELIYEETKNRLNKMSSPEYIFPEKASIADHVGIVVVVIVCLILVTLCMMGVIS